ncbi:hypothetical protein BCS65_21515 [Vibrio cyclitrophicus]
MDLKDFVKEALVQITEGVKESQEIIREHGGYANPAARTSSSNIDSHIGTLKDGQSIYLVNFDISISVTESTEINGSSKLTVASFLNLGAGVESSDSSSTLSRIAFKVPLALPVDKVSQKALQKESRESQDRQLRAATL